MNTLILAPFSNTGLTQIGLLSDLSYESWIESDRLYSPDELIYRINREHINILVVEADFVFEEVFRNTKDLQFLGICRTSLNHIDIDSATENNVLVVNTPGRNAQAVAELTLGLMLSLSRRITYWDSYVKSGSWDNPVAAYSASKGFELKSQTIGLIGLGSIGQEVSRICNSLGMTVLAYDPFVGEIGENKSGATITNLDHLLKESQFLSIHIPYTSDTEGLIGGRELGLMKKGSFIINTASHAVINELELVKHLKSHHLGGIAMDVHEAHPIPPNSPILKLDNVILTPHIGGATKETIERHSSLMVESIKFFVDGLSPPRLVNPEVWDRYEH